MGYQRWHNSADKGVNSHTPELLKETKNRITSVLIGIRMGIVSISLSMFYVVISLAH